VLAYPNSYPETSCIAVLEAMAAGCVVVTSERGALPETSAGFARLDPVEGHREAYVEWFAAETVQALRRLADPDTAQVCMPTVYTYCSGSDNRSLTRYCGAAP
jgi:hypothetical protein